MPTVPTDVYDVTENDEVIYYIYQPTQGRQFFSPQALRCGQVEKYEYQGATTELFQEHEQFVVRHKGKYVNSEMRFDVEDNGYGRALGEFIYRSGIGKERSEPSWGFAPDWAKYVWQENDGSWTWADKKVNPTRVQHAADAPYPPKQYENRPEETTTQNPYLFCVSTYFQGRDEEGKPVAFSKRIMESYDWREATEFAKRFAAKFPHRAVEAWSIHSMNTNFPYLFVHNPPKGAKRRVDDWAWH